MRQRARHPARRVMLRQSIRRQNVRILRIRRSRILIPSARLALRHRIILHRRIHRISHGRLQRLVVRRQRPIDNSRRRPDPPEPIRMQNKRLVSRQSIIPHRTFRRLDSPAASSRQNPAHRCPSISSAPHPTKLISSARSTAFHPASRTPGCKSRADPTATPIPIHAHKNLSTPARSLGSALLSETRRCKSSTHTPCCRPPSIP